jgi:catechol 2,3-dioxygenase-like lactoylglutathione lyase family enzyme
MIDHISTYATDFVATRRFYELAFEPLGYSVQAEMKFDDDPELPGRRICAFGENNKATFWVIESNESYTPRHIAFAAQNRAAVDAFYQSGLKAGGQDNGAPGLRSIYHPDYYGAFLLDPDHNNIEAVCHQTN